MQLEGPVPAPLYHRYVEFKPFVAGMFTNHSLRGRVLNRGLHHQHARIYNYDKSTLYGQFPQPNKELTKQFLDFVHYDQGGRIFTYVLSLDAQLRFTETGKEFGIDLLSKHTMHSDVSIYIACSGEFFIRRLKHARHQTHQPPDPGPEIQPPAPEPDSSDVNHAHHPQFDSSSPGRDPSQYELIIDNDSGTYRPRAEYLPLLKDFLSHNLPGLKVVTLDCQGDKEKMDKLKDEQRERKKQSGKQITYQQNASDSSLSSSDVEEMDRRGAEIRYGESAKKGMQHLKQGMGEVGGIGGGGRTPEHQHVGHEADGGIVGENAPVSQKEEQQKQQARGLSETMKKA